MNLESPDVRACVSCIPSQSDVQCSCCCGTTNSDCELEWSWGAVLATLSVSAVFATCSGILALAEKRRKRKGLSLARAWSLPHGMPVVSSKSGGGRGLVLCCCLCTMLHPFIQCDVRSLILSSLRFFGGYAHTGAECTWKAQKSGGGDCVFCLLHPPVPYLSIGSLCGAKGRSPVSASTRLPRREVT